MTLIFFLRSFVFTFVFVVATLLYSLMGLFNNFFLRQKKYDDWIISSWAKLACWLFNVKLRIHNPEKIPETGCLFLFNHSSFFDIFALCSVIEDVRFGAKSELFSIPLFGQAMRRAGTLPIARGKRDEVFKVYSEAVPRIKNNEKFALSAEGGRFYGQDLAPFKTGPFVFAISAQAPIVPVIIKGAFETLPKTSFFANANRWGSQIDIYFLDSHSVQGYDFDQRQLLQKELYEIMNKEWHRVNE